MLFIRWRYLNDPGALDLALFAVVAFTVIATARRWRLAWLRHHPGPVEVRALRDATDIPEAPTVGGGATEKAAARDVPVHGATARLRDVLSDVRLEAPTATPGEVAPADGFFDVVGSAAAGSKSLAFLVGLLKAVWEPHAYTVEGALRQRHVEPRYGVTVTLHSPFANARMVETVWGYTWSDAIDNAAYAVAATILPQTRLSRRAPWRDWMGRQMPGALLRHYQRGQDLTRLKRYDEALGAYYQALEYDPLNLSIRLEIAALQELLQLYLDALLTYNAVVDIGTSTTTELARQRRENSRRSTGSHVMPTGHDPGLHHAVFLARYRYGLMLGFGNLIAEQWVASESEEWQTQRVARTADVLSFELPPARVIEMKDLRRRLATRLVEYLPDAPPPNGEEQSTEDAQFAIVRSILLRSMAPPAAAAKDLRKYQSSRRGNGAELRARMSRASTSADEPDATRDAAALTTFLQSRGSDELTQLLSDFATLPHRNRQVPPVSPTALALATEWIEQRQKLRTPLSASVMDLTATISKHFASADRAPTWSDHYNAACMWAIQLERPAGAARPRDAGGDACPATVTDPERRRLVAVEAVSRLELAVHVPSANQLVQKSAWLISGDPDLAALRKTPQFTDFAGRVMPQSGAHVVLPVYLHRLQTSEYVRRLAWAAAQQRHQSWNHRLAGLQITDHLQHVDQRHHEWKQRDDEALRRAVRTARNYPHWQSRLDFLLELHQWSEREGVPLRDVRYPDTRWVLDHLRRRHLVAAEDTVETVMTAALNRFEASVRDLATAQPRAISPTSGCALCDLCHSRREFWRRIENTFTLEAMYRPVDSEPMEHVPAAGGRASSPIHVRRPARLAARLGLLALVGRHDSEPAADGAQTSRWWSSQAISRY